jgi:DNA-binding IclR family transcriptional regulator
MSQTVGRAIDIIEFVAEKPRTLGAIALHEEVHKSTALRLLQTLEARGLSDVTQVAATQSGSE